MYSIAGNAKDNQRFVASIRGYNLEGDEISKLVAVNLPVLEDTSGKDVEQIGRERLRNAGLTFMDLGGTTQVAAVRFGSPAKRSSWEQGWDVEDVMVANPNRPTPLLFFIPGLILIAGVWWLQGQRIRRQEKGTVA